MALIDSIVVFAASLLVGGAGIYIGARLISGRENYRYALSTALIGAIVWAIFSIIPVLGTLLALIAWITVIKWRYREGWIDAILIGLLAWLTTLVILYLLSTVNIFRLSALGVPGA